MSLLDLDMDFTLGSPESRSSGPKQVQENKLLTAVWAWQRINMRKIEGLVYAVSLQSTHFYATPAQCLCFWIKSNCITEGCAIQWSLFGLIISSCLGLVLGQQCFVSGECSGILVGIAPESGADACLTSVCNSVHAISVIRGHPFMTSAKFLGF